MPPIELEEREGNVSAPALELSRLVERGIGWIDAPTKNTDGSLVKITDPLESSKDGQSASPAFTAKEFLRLAFSKLNAVPSKEMSCPFPRESSPATNLVQRIIRDSKQ